MPVVLIAIAALVAIFIAFLGWDRFKEFFRSRRNKLTAADKAPLKMQIQEVLANGQYETVNILWDEEGEDIVDGEKIDSNDVDDRIKDMHRNEKIVVLQ